jgi:hypothetical protein
VGCVGVWVCVWGGVAVRERGCVPHVCRARARGTGVTAPGCALPASQPRAVAAHTTHTHTHTHTHTRSLRAAPPHPAPRAREPHLFLALARAHVCERLGLAHVDLEVARLVVHAHHLALIHLGACCHGSRGRWGRWCVRACASMAECARGGGWAACALWSWRARGCPAGNCRCGSQPPPPPLPLRAPPRSAPARRA